MTAAERREQLLDVTCELACERGFHAVSIEAVARRAGITRPIVYGHFEDLEGLLEAMLDRESVRALSQLAALLPSPDAAPDDRRELLLRTFAGYLEAVRSAPTTWRLVLMPPEGAPPSMRERITQGREAIVAALAVIVRPGLAPGRESPDPPLTARMLSAVADEAARLHLTDPEAFPVERLMAQAEWLLGEVIAPPR